MGTCAYRNFGHRSRCRICDALPEGQAALRAGGKGARPGSSCQPGAQAIGGIAARQLQQQRQSEAAACRDRVLEQERAEHRRTAERLQRVQRQLEAARKNGIGADTSPEADEEMEDEDADDDGTDDKKEQELVSEVKQVDDFLRGLVESSPLRDAATKRAAEAKAELQALRERRGGPEAKVLGLAGRHAKLLRSTRAKLLRKSRAQERLEGELEELAEERKRLEDKYTEKKKQLEEAREQAKQAHDELEKLSKTCESTSLDGSGSSTGHGANSVQAAALAMQLCDVLPAEWQPQLGALLKTMVDQSAASAQQQQQSQQQLPKKQPEEDDGEDMADLDASTVELLDTFLEVAAEDDAQTETVEVAGAGAGTESHGSSRSLAAVLRSKGTTTEKFRRVIKDLKTKHTQHARAEHKSAAKAAAAALAAAAGGGPRAEDPNL
jgi:hypothetical protein